MTKYPRKKSPLADRTEQTASKITRRDLLKAAGAAGAAALIPTSLKGASSAASPILDGAVQGSAAMPLGRR